MKTKNKKQVQAQQRRARKEERRKRKQAGVQKRNKEEENIEKPRILIVCEGVNTEPSYFNQFEVTSAIVRAIGEGRNTVSLVQKTKEWQEKANSNGHPYDQVWCVFDKDDFDDKQFNEAVKLAEEEYNFGVAYSNQAFEYWLLLHFNDHQGGQMNRKVCCKELNKLITRYGCYYDDKHSKVVEENLFKLMLKSDDKDIKKRTRQELAILRAERNYTLHKDSTPAQAESSTTVFRLVLELNKYK